MLILISQIINQSSALWMSLLLVPSSAMLMVGWGDLSSFSGVMMALVVLVFIGGLLVLLVGVSSTTKQEQSVSTFKFVLSALLCSSVFLVLETKTSTVLFQVFFFSWVVWGTPSLYLLCSILMVSLMLITWLAISFKGSLRGIYYYSI